MNTMPAQPFDEYADNYEGALSKGLSVSGESKDYFAEHRVRILQKRLRSKDYFPRRILDFGCGTGSGIPWLLAMDGVEAVIGTDVSTKSLETASKRFEDPRVDFVETKTITSMGKFDLIFCNGVFHHILPSDRAEVLTMIRNRLNPRGIFALWENNPWNPGTRIIMSRIPFDRDAVTITPPEAERLAESAEFQILWRTHAFVFPSALRFLRWLEPLLSGLPLGAQYMVLAGLPAGQQQSQQQNL